MAKSSSNFLAFVLGGVVVLLVIIGIVALNGEGTGGDKTRAVTEAPQIAK